jgi:hypothetical protein
VGRRPGMPVAALHGVRPPVGQANAAPCPKAPCPATSANLTGRPHVKITYIATWDATRRGAAFILGGDLATIGLSRREQA